MSVHIMRKGVDKRFVDVLVYLDDGANNSYTQYNTDRKRWRREYTDCRYILHLPAEYRLSTDYTALFDIITDTVNSITAKSIAIPQQLFDEVSVMHIYGRLSEGMPDNLKVYIISEDKRYIGDEKYCEIKKYISSKYTAQTVNTEIKKYVRETKTSLSVTNWFSDDTSVSEEADDYLNDVIAILKRNSKDLSKELTVEEYVRLPSLTFADALLKFMEEKGVDEVECYKRANVNRRTFSKIKTDTNYHPSKKTVFAFAISLKLTYEETEQLLKTAGYSFSYSSKMDLIVEYFILNEKYDIFEINEALFEFDEPLLGI